MNGREIEVCINLTDLVQKDDFCSAVLVNLCEL